MLAHHARKARDGAALDGAEAALVDLAGEVVVEPTGVVGTDVDARVVAVPSRQVRVHIRFHGSQVARDERDDARDARLALAVDEECLDPQVRSSDPDQEYVLGRVVQL